MLGRTTCRTRSSRATIGARGRSLARYLGVAYSVKSVELDLERASSKK